MIFQEGNSYTIGTKLTGIDETLGERFPLNHAIWSPSNDLKVCWAHVNLTAAGASVYSSSGISSVSRAAQGRVTLTLVSALDSAVAQCFIAQPILTAGAVASRRYCTVNTASTTTFTVYVWTSAGAAVDGDFFVVLFSGDAGTTDITDNSSTTPLTANSLNRVLACGNYQNPHIDTGIVMMISAMRAYTAAGDPGDTLSELSNIDVHTRNGEGSYSTTYDADYYGDPVSFVTVVGTSLGFAMIGADADSIEVRTTNGQNATLSDMNYMCIVLGPMEVS